ncbi:MAG: hypothetical protein ABSA53_06215 [Streptosporangiaceae bacterium]
MTGGRLRSAALPEGGRALPLGTKTAGPLSIQDFTDFADALNTAGRQETHPATAKAIVANQERLKQRSPVLDAGAAGDIPDRIGGRWALK